MAGHSSAYPDRVLEWEHAALMLVWGAWLVAPWWKTFDNPSYSALAALGPEGVWGLFSIAVAAVRVVALWANGSYRRSPALRCFCAILGMIWWLTLIWMFISAPQPHPAAGFAFYPVFVFFEAISITRSAADGWHTKAFRLPSRRVVDE